MATRSHVEEFERLPAAIISDGLLPVPLFAVSRMTLTERFTLPPIGASAFRAAVGNSTDTISLSAVLVGPQRFAWKLSLELLADFSKRGGAIGSFTSGAVSGLILITRMTVRTNLQVTELSFTASAQRLDTLDVTIGLQHVPRPGPADLLLDVGAAAAMTAVEFLT
jgi:hypothetical protein